MFCNKRVQTKLKMKCAMKNNKIFFKVLLSKHHYTSIEGFLFRTKHRMYFLPRISSNPVRVKKTIYDWCCEPYCPHRPSRPRTHFPRHKRPVTSLVQQHVQAFTWPALSTWRAKFLMAVRMLQRECCCLAHPPGFVGRLVPAVREHVAGETMSLEAREPRENAVVRPCLRHKWVSDRVCSNWRTRSSEKHGVRK